MSRFTLHQGDCREVMRDMADSSVDAIVTDPPYHLTTGKKGGTGLASVNLENPYGRARVTTGFMGMQWDGGDVAMRPETWAEAPRVAKPGAHMVVFGGTRTFHRVACAIEDAGWELRDTSVRGHTPEDCPWLMGWMYGSGFPKSHNGEWGGTAQKPAWEPIILARKPLIGTVAANFAQWGTGGLNIDGCRIVPTGEGDYAYAPGDHGIEGRERTSGFAMSAGRLSEIGRWPANLMHDGSQEVVRLFPNADGGSPVRGDEPSAVTAGIYGDFAGRVPFAGFNDAGSAARFFYCAKASQEDRDEGIQTAARMFGMSSAAAAAAARGEFYDNGDGGVNRVTLRRNIHPTVKPTDLMRWLVRLITPAGGLVLDPFTGSGSTGKAAMLEGMRFVGIDLSADYLEISRARIDFALRQGHQPDLLEEAA